MLAVFFQKKLVKNRCYSYFCRLSAFFIILVGSVASFAFELPKNTPSSAVPEKKVHHIDTLNIHDPAVLADPKSKRYFVYDSYHHGQDYEKLESPNGRAGVEAYWSEDLETWHGPTLVYEIEEDSWAQSEHAPWAPEIQFYEGKYYLFLTFHNYDVELESIDGRPKIIKRASQILVSDSPLGPYKRFENKPHTPEGEMTLDGTLWVEDGQPWMIYCQEWIQTGDGLIKAIKLSNDLSKTVGEPITLLNAGDVDWTAKLSFYEGKDVRAVVTDGPWLYKSKTGKLMMLWSSWNIDKSKAYTTSLAFSDNGKVEGTWSHRKEPLIAGDRGHGNIFRAFDGTLMMSLHRYFKQPHTRLQLFEIEDLGNDLNIVKQTHGHQ